MKVNIDENGISITDRDEYVVGWSTEEYVEDPETVVPAIVNAIRLAYTSPGILKSLLLSAYIIPITP